MQTSKISRTRITFMKRRLRAFTYRAPDAEPSRRTGQFSQFHTTISFSSPYADFVAPSRSEVFSATSAGSVASPLSSTHRQDVTVSFNPSAFSSGSAGRQLETQISFATPFSDVAAPSASEVFADAWRNAAQYIPNISFASPFSDAVAPTRAEVMMQSVTTTYVPALSYSSPFADYVAPTAEEIQLGHEAARNAESISFSSPFSDSVAPSSQLIMSFTHHRVEHHEPALSYGSPFSDFVAPSAQDLVHQDASQQQLTEQQSSTTLSFSAPYADFCTQDTANLSAAAPDTSLSFSSAFADFAAPTMAEIQAGQEAARSVQQSISLASPFSDSVMDSAAELAAVRASMQALEMQEQQDSELFAAMPQSLAEALQLSDTSPQARVITEAQHPFKITYVNDAWVQLCGFTAEEAVGRTLSLLQGPKTDLHVLNDIRHAVSEGRERAVHQLVNYKKGGAVFENRLRVVPLQGDGQVTHLLGVLQDVGALRSQHA